MASSRSEAEKNSITIESSSKIILRYVRDVYVGSPANIPRYSNKWLDQDTERKKIEAANAGTQTGEDEAEKENRLSSEKKVKKNSKEDNRDREEDDDHSMIFHLSL
jgi:hypothetical protein